MLFPDLEVDLEPDLEAEDWDEDDLEEDDRDPPHPGLASVKVKNNINIQSTNKTDNDLFVEDILMNCHGQGYDRHTNSLFI